MIALFTASAAASGRRSADVARRCSHHYKSRATRVPTGEDRTPQRRVDGVRQAEQEVPPRRRAGHRRRTACSARAQVTSVLRLLGCRRILMEA